MIIIALFALGLAIAIAGGLVVVVTCVRAEDRGRLPHRAPTRTAAAVRSLTGLRVCLPDPAQWGQRPISRNATHRADSGSRGHSPVRMAGGPASARSDDTSPVITGSTDSDQRPA